MTVEGIGDPIVIDNAFRLRPLAPRACWIRPQGGGSSVPAAALGSVLLGPDNTVVEIAEYWYRTLGEPEPRKPLEVGWAAVVQLLGGPDRLRPLEERRRLGIYRWQMDGNSSYFVECKVVRWSEDSPGNLGSSQAPEGDELDRHLSGGSSAAVVSSAGATRGSRSALLGDAGRRRNLEALRFTAFDARIPSLSLALGTVIPFWAMHGSPKDRICM